MRPIMKLLQQIMSTPKAAILLTKNIHDREPHHDPKARRSEHIENMLRPGLCEPVVDEVCEAVEQEVLEQHSIPMMKISLFMSLYASSA